MNLDEFEHAVDRNIQSGAWGTGAQLVVLCGNSTLVDKAVGVDGTGATITPDSMFAIYCATKPLVSLAIAALVEDGELSLDDRLEDLLDPPVHPALHPITIESLLTHTAGLHHASSGYLLNPPTVREQLIRGTAPLPLPTPGAGIYSEYVAWHLLGMVIESIAQEPFDAHVNTMLRERYGVTDATFRPTPAQRTQLRVNIDMTSGHVAAPLHWEVSESNLADARAAQGGYSSMRALAHLLHAASGKIKSSPALSDFLAIRTLSHFDHVLGREVRHGCGFMVDGTNHFLPALGQDAFGHSGLGGMTVAFSSPQQGITIALHTNGLTLDAVARRESISTTLTNP